MKIVLVAIVKDEEIALRPMLESVRGIVDEYVIVDTGSTDGTRAIIEEYGPVYERPFVDFVTTKNEALALARGRGDYVLFMDADERIEQGLDKLKAYAEAGVYAVNALIVEGGSEVVQRYYRNRLWRNDGSWQFDGPGVHECIVSDGHGERVTDGAVQVRHDHRHRTAESYPVRNAMYSELLERALEKDPNDRRALFYMGRTQKDAGDWLTAIEFYERYLALPITFRDEYWQSAYDVAVCYQKMGEYVAALAALTWAKEIDPRRAEAWALEAELYYARQDWAEVERAARGAAALPVPEDVQLFQNPLAHGSIAMDYLAIALAKQNRQREALDETLRLLRLRPLDSRVLHNVRFLRGAANRKIFFALGQTPEPVWGGMIDEVGVGGVETTYLELPKMLAARGHTVYVFCRTERAHLSDGVIFAPWQTMGAYEDLRPDVLVTSRWFEPLHREAFKAAKKVIWLQDAHFADPDWPGTYEVADLVVCSSQWHRDYIAQRLGEAVQAAKIHIIPLGIRKAMFAGLPEKIAGRVIYSSNPDRGLGILAQMWPDLCRQRPDLTLRIAYGWEGLRTWGEGAEWQAHCDRTEAEIRGLFGEWENVTFTGRLKKADLYRELAQAQLCLYPNNFQETFCLTALECQAAGTPMVTTAMGALVTTLNPHSNVLIAGSPGSQGYRDAFVAAGVNLLNDAERMAEYGRACAAYVADNAVEWADIAGVWENLLYRG
jgi:glycosyltransferase involved in cell wall biosynthesis